MVGMLIKACLDLLVVLVQLELQGVGQAGQADGQQALGESLCSDDSRRYFNLVDWHSFNTRFTRNPLRE